MSILDKLKKALFEEVEEEDEPNNKVEKDVIAKKIDVSKTALKREEKIVPSEPINISEEKKDENLSRFKREDKPKAPIIFDDEDFISDTKEIKFNEVPKKEEKILYGGEKKDEIRKQNFKPSPVISPVYGIVKLNRPEPVIIKKSTSEAKSLDYLMSSEPKDTVTLDTIRQKAFGDEKEKSLLYEMQERDDKPGVERVTVGDAVEYFEDLGLEYNVDYQDNAKASLTRRKKNKDLSDTVEKENIKSKDIKKNQDDAEEKNLYDLIDMMYDNKE